MKYSEEIRDLFTVSDNYYIAHCISGDFALGKGIAVEIDRRFNMRYKLNNKYYTYTEFIAGDCILIDKVFNLVTKLHYYDKPTYKSITEALHMMKHIVIGKHITHIAMPCIGCGLDRLEWSRVSFIIQNIFSDTDVEILVCKTKPVPPKNKDLSFLKEIVTENNGTVKVSSLTDIVPDLVIKYKPLGNIKIAALKREDFVNKPEILNKYFRNNNTDLDRFHIPMLTAKQYEDAVSNDSRVKDVNKKFSTASDYYIKKIRIAEVAKDLKVNIKQIDLSDYIWDERYYIRYSFLENIDVVDDWYKNEGSVDRHSITAYGSYIKLDPRTAVMDIALFDELYAFCVQAIRQRKVMLLGKVDKCLNILNNILDYTNGFAENPTQSMVSSMKSYIEYFRKMLEDKETAEFLKNNNDLTVFAADEFTRSDYINTYISILKNLTKCSDEELSEVSDLISGIEDPWLEEYLMFNN